MMKLLRFETMVAVLALLLSALAAGAAVYQTHVIADQYSATVWPYVSYTVTNSPTEYRLDVENDGLGPALVRSAELRVDGKPIAGWIPMLHELVGKRSSTRLEDRSFGAGDVIRPAQSETLLDIKDKTVRDLLAKNRSRATISICYCSLLERCWLILYPSEAAPKDATCDSPGAGISA